MNVLLIGPGGYIGSALEMKLRDLDISLSTATCSRGTGAARRTETDITYLAGLMGDVGVVIHCAESDAGSNGHDARCIVEAAIRSGVGKIVHMSSMAAQGFANPCMNEETLIAGAGSHDGDGTAMAEGEMARFQQYGEVVILRLGCVVGTGSSRWVRCIGSLLSERRIGDLGRMGDGWSNIVALDDVCQAVILSVVQPASAQRLNVFNLAAPDSPRWNTYFRDFALAIDAAPLRRISAGRIRLEVFAKAPAIRAYGRLCQLFPMLPACKRDAITPSLIKIFHLAGKLKARRINAALPVRWTPYEETVKHAAAWYLAEHHGQVPERIPVSYRTH